MNSTRTRRVAAAVAAGLTALSLAGCSGGPDWPSAGAASTQATPSATAAPPVTSAPVDPAAGDSGSAPGGGSGGGSDGGAGGGSGGAAAGRCTTGELRGSLGPADGAAGSVNQTLILTNIGSRTCTLRGFPGVSYVGGDDGQQVGPSAAMDGARGGDVRLGVGGSAGAQLRLTNVQNYDPAVCRPTPVRGLRVYPPGDTASLFVPREGTGCAGTPPGQQLSVRTLAAR